MHHEGPLPAADTSVGPDPADTPDAADTPNPVGASDPSDALDASDSSGALVDLDTLLADALRLLHGPGSRHGRAILGLAGPPAAGKSTLAAHLVAEIARREGQDAVAHLPLDGFHLSNTQLDRLGLRARKGSPETFDAWGYVALLQRVATDRFRDIYVPDFDRTLDEPVAACHVIRPHTRLVITEGNYLAADEAPWQAAREHLHELWYLDTADAVRDARLLDRHRTGGQDHADARHRIDTNDHPNGEYVKAGAQLCTRIVQVPDLHAAPDGRSVS